MKRIRVLCLIPVWQRYQAFEIHLKGMKRLLKNTAEYMELLPFYAISENKAIQQIIDEQLNVTWMHLPNSPLGRKKNEALKEALHIPFDYLMELGSDDLVSDDYMRAASKLMYEKKKFFGVSKFTAVNMMTMQKKQIDLRPFTIGAGRCIRKDILEKAFDLLDGEVWENEKQRSLDMNMEDRLIRVLGLAASRIDSSYYDIVDLKDEGSINGWEAYSEDAQPYLPADVMRLPELSSYATGVLALD